MGARASLEAGCTRDMRNAWSAGPSGHPASSPDASALSITNRPRSTSRSLVAGAKVVAVLARAAGAAAQAARAQRLLLLLLLALLPLCVRPKVERCNSMVRKLGANGCGRERRALGRGRGCGDGARVRARYCASSRALSCLLYCQLVRSIKAARSTCGLANSCRGNASASSCPSASGQELRVAGPERLIPDDVAVQNHRHAPSAQHGRPILSLLAHIHLLLLAYHHGALQEAGARLCEAGRQQRQQRGNSAVRPAAGAARSCCPLPGKHAPPS